MAFLNANSAKIIGSWFSPAKISAMMGIYLAASNLGMTAGTGTTAMLPGTKSAYTIAAVLALVLVIIWFVFMKNPVHTESRQAEMPSMNILDSVKVVLKNRSVWVVGFCLMFVLGCNVVISSFMPTALG